MKRQCEGCGDLTSFGSNVLLCPDCQEFIANAPETIAALRAENERMREALERISKIAQAAIDDELQVDGWDAVAEILTIARAEVTR